MIKVERINTFNFEAAIRGMRNPKNSWDKSDSLFDYNKMCLGANDLTLMQRLFKGGSEHRKFMRQIFISMDITAPFYWWKEFDTYKVGTTADSCSTIHKLAAKPFTLDDFSHEHLNDESTDYLLKLIDLLNWNRELFLKDKNKSWWWQMIQLLPSSYNQKRTITMNYENAASMIRQRSGHKLNEWREFVEVLRQLPHMMDICEDDKDEG